MKHSSLAGLIALGFLSTGSAASLEAPASSEALALRAESALLPAPLMAPESKTASPFAADAAMAQALPATDSTYVVKAARPSARGTLYVLERASDGAQADVELVDGKSEADCAAASTRTSVNVVGTQVRLSAAGDDLVFPDTELRRARQLTVKRPHPGENLR